MTDTAYYDRAIAVVERQLTKKGRAVTLIKEGSAGGGYDADGNPQGAAADVTVTGVGAALGYKRDEIDGTVIQSGDCKLLYKGGTPVIGMFVTLSGIKWRVVALLPLDPAGILVMYELQLRK